MDTVIPKKILLLGLSSGKNCDKLFLSVTLTGVLPKPITITKR